MVNNSIRNLSDTISTKFHDKMATISTATNELYHIPGLSTEQIIELTIFFSSSEGHASAFLMLHESECITFAFKLYDHICASRAVPGASSLNILL